ncbi:MAG TPA: hypothetical protein VIJ23_13335 [Mycobacterium sp.]
MPLAVVLIRVTVSWPRSTPAGSGSAARMTMSPAACGWGPVFVPGGAGSGAMTNSSGHTVSRIVCPVAVITSCRFPGRGGSASSSSASSRLTGSARSQVSKPSKSVNPAAR